MAKQNKVRHKEEMLNQKFKNNVIASFMYAFFNDSIQNYF